VCDTVYLEPSDEGTDTVYTMLHIVYAGASPPLNPNPWFGSMVQFGSILKWGGHDPPTLKFDPPTFEK